MIVLECVYKYLDKFSQSQLKMNEISEAIILAALLDIIKTTNASSRSLEVSLSVFLT